MKTVGTFKNEYTFEKRVEESKRILDLYPDRIPTIVETPKSSDMKINGKEKSKFLFPRSYDIGKTLCAIRKRIQNLNESQALFLLVNNQMYGNACELSTVYDEHKDKDGFLYIVISLENTFG